MPITKKVGECIEFSGIDAVCPATSQCNDSGPDEKNNLFWGRSVCIPQERDEAYLKGEDDNGFAPEKIFSDRAAPPTPVNLNSADLMARNHRSRVGGKGQFLSVMTGAGLPVPPFQVIEHSALQVIDDVVIEPELLAPFHPGGIDASQLQPVTLGSLKEGIPTMDRINQEKWLDALGKLLISDAFLPQVANQPIARNIRTLHQQAASRWLKPAGHYQKLRTNRRRFRGYPGR